MKPVVKKLSAMLLSLAMVVSLTPIPGGLLLADETDAATPTTVGDTEPENKKDPEKPAAEKPKETKKPAETAPKETKETETEAPKEKESTETEAPKETEKKEAEAPKEKESTETEAPKETEKPAEEAPTETVPETEAPAETEKPETEQPKESEAPAETEKPAEETPAESEKPEEGNPEIPEETVPGESDVNDPQEAPIVPSSIIGVDCTDGLLKWNAVTGATQYEIKIADYSFNTTKTTYEIGKTIDKLIETYDLDNDSPYWYINLYAYDKSGNYKAEYKGSIYYYSNAVFKPGAITGHTIKNGILTWNKFPGADHYYLYIDGAWTEPIYTNSINLNNAIDNLIERDEIEKSSNNKYSVTITAETSDWTEIASVTLPDYEYISTAAPIYAGKITNPKITDGVLTWDAYTGAAKYYVGLSSAWGKLTDKATLKIGNVIDELIANGALYKSYDNKYYFEILAYDSKDREIGYWYGYLPYEATTFEPTIGTIQNPSVSAKGILSWSAYPGTTKYWVVIDWEWIEATTTSINLHQELERLIKENDDFKHSNGKYNITISADNRYGATIAECTITYTYNTSTTYIEPGTITGVTFDTNGKVSWDNYPGSVRYDVYVEDCKSTVKTNTFAINSRINSLVSAGYILNSSPYTIYIYAYDKDGVFIAEWDGNYNYKTSSKPITYGRISNLKSTNGILTWSKYKGAVKYAIKIDYRSKADAYTTGTSCYLNNVITALIAKGELSNYAFYDITVEALNKQGAVIASADLYYMLLDSNTLNVSGKTIKAKRRKTKSFAASKAISFIDKGQGKLTYSKASGSKKIKVSSAGKITVKKGLKKKTYKVKINVKAAGQSVYAATVKTVTVKVKVK